ncbi:hypothetical protein [Deinococcus cellulosilyticus]|uniref:Uncharacterized protein n=1 Tax=Deinococcus cellulosilyticus (strain DSM 18568 / NBRC 106333 / KACC 11606 / 5516J-15) TaxID=1223518 RepID=A0A511MZY6_DEIC1|nr:hypothetical protein [Deinococcus cellulosilyticus]GEM46122.1 hypothetical protein DC3_17570 [Deinococcus cellulosilyticus NBRC 106333 = KACC 11606]
MNTTRHILATLMVALGLHAAAQNEVQSQPLKASAYGIIQVPAAISERSNLPVRFTVVNEGRGILNATYSGCFVTYEVRSASGKLVAKSSATACLKASGGFSVLNQADYPFLEGFVVNTQNLRKGEYLVSVSLKVDGQIGTRPVKSIQTTPVKFAVR